MEHEQLTTLFHHTRFWATLSIPLQLALCVLISVSVPPLPAARPAPSLFLCRFEVRAWHVMLDTGFLRLCPIQPHFCCRICLVSGSCPAHCCRSSLLILSGHLMLKMHLRQVLMKVGILSCIIFVLLHVSHRYSRTNLTLEMKRRSLVVVLIPLVPDALEHDDGCSCLANPSCDLLVGSRHKCKRSAQKLMRK